MSFRAILRNARTFGVISRDLNNCKKNILLVISCVNMLIHGAYPSIIGISFLIIALIDSCISLVGLLMASVGQLCINRLIHCMNW